MLNDEYRSYAANELPPHHPRNHPSRRSINIPEEKGMKLQDIGNGDGLLVKMTRIAISGLPRRMQHRP